MGKRGLLILMNLLYYLAFFALIFMLILPHTTIFYNWSIFDPFGKRVNTKTVYLTVGEQYQIKLFKVNRQASYKSSDFKVANVMGNGIVTAYRPGKTIVSVVQKEETYKWRIYVVKLKKTKLKLRPSQIRKLTVKGKSSGVRWKSENSYVATVNRFGWVKGKHKGSTIIVAKVGGRKLKCRVYVK